MFHNVWYLNGPPSHGTLPYEYLTPILSRILVSSILAFFIQMVTVYLVIQWGLFRMYIL